MEALCQRWGWEPVPGWARGSSTQVSLVNIMTFDYHDLPGGVDMGTAAS